jgi:hypothetical protein
MSSSPPKLILSTQRPSTISGLLGGKPQLDIKHITTNIGEKSGFGGIPPFGGLRYGGIIDNVLLNLGRTSGTQISNAFYAVPYLPIQQLLARLACMITISLSCVRRLGKRMPLVVSPVQLLLWQNSGVREQRWANVILLEQFGH